MEKVTQNVSDNGGKVIKKENGKYALEEVKEAGEDKPTFGFTEKSWRTDFVLIVEGTKLYVSKTILSLASPVFDAMFQSDFKESSCEELELPGKKLNDVIEFLRCIYPNTISQITSRNALCILPLVEEYQVIQLKPRCEAALLESVNEETPIEDMFLLLKHACLYDLKELRERCADLASLASKQQLDEASEKCPLPSEGANEILERVNNKLRETNANLEKEIERTSREADKTATQLKATNADLADELVIIKQYLSTELKKYKELPFEVGYNWAENVTVFNVDVKKGSTQTEQTVLLWNIPLLISTSVKNEWFHIEIQNRGRVIKCLFKARVFLVNRQSQGLNETTTIEGQIEKGNQVIWNMYARKVNEIKVYGNRSLYKGKVRVLVHVFMTEPNREKAAACRLM